VHWVRPELVVEVAFIEWTAHGKLRHARLLGLRD
jgi:bifunctional non-homologous end joining protein LigD